MGIFIMICKLAANNCHDAPNPHGWLLNLPLPFINGALSGCPDTATNKQELAKNMPPQSNYPDPLPSLANYNPSVSRRACSTLSQYPAILNP